VHSSLEDPYPPSLDEVTTRFPGALFTLQQQPSVEEIAVGTIVHTTNEQSRYLSAAITYTLWRRPENRDDPANLADISSELRTQLDEPPVRPLPARLMEIRARLQFPMLWEAVLTTLIDPKDPGPRTIESTLTDHVNHVLRNRFRDTRVQGTLPGELLGGATAAAVERGVAVSVDSRPENGVLLDTDAHVLGIGAELEGRHITAVIARDDLPFLNLAFATRQSPGAL
jgi:hypothetical protein